MSLNQNDTVHFSNSESTIDDRITGLDWADLSGKLDTNGFALLPPILLPCECAAITSLYDDKQSVSTFRSTINMARYHFGSGEYKYFAYPLPDAVNALRQALYPPLAIIANAWGTQLGNPSRWPGKLDSFIANCRQNGQARPTPLMLRYHAGDYNCLHQDLYGDVYFPLQVVFMLSKPGDDFAGGELVLVEQRPRMQSRAMVLNLPRGAAAIIPVRERPRLGTRGYHRVQMRHGVSVISRGQRTTLGIIFHDAR